MKMKSISKKLIICLLVFLLLFNFLIGSVSKVNVVFADDPPSDNEVAQDAEEEADNLLGGFLNGLAGILTWIPRALINVCSMLCQTLAYFVINTAGNTGDVSPTITPFDIFFNKFTLTNINIFQTDDIESTSGGDLVYSIRETAAMLYYVVRAVSIGILLIMLLLIGIKMALASLAEEKARIKTMFFDWLVSAGLVFLMHLIILAVITVNEFLVDLIAQVAEGADVSGMIDSLRSAAFSVNFLLGWGSTIAYSILTVQTMAFAVIYIVRLFKVIFLIVLSPIMPLTYSIDKAKGGKAVSLNGWLREFVYNVFIQVIHCLIYVVIVAVPMSAISSASIGSISSLTQPLILIIALMFVKKAEELLKSLFGFDKSTTLTSFSSVVNNSQRALLTGVSIANGTYTVNNNLSNNTTTFGSNIQTIGQRASNKVHEYRDKAVNWLDNHERTLDSGGDSSDDVVDAEYRRLDEDEDDVVDAEYKELDGNDESADEQEGEPIPILLPGRSLSSEDTERVAAAVRSTQHDEENEEDNEKKTEELNEENIEEHFEEEGFFGKTAHDRRGPGGSDKNYLDDKEKADFIRDLEDILQKYRDGHAELEDIIKRFEEHGLEYDEKTIQNLLDKFGLGDIEKEREEQRKEDKAKKPEATELTKDNIEKFIDRNNIISRWRNEKNYRDPQVREEFIRDLMRRLEKYKNGEIGIDELKKNFAEYGLEADDNTINNLIKEFAPEKLEEKPEETKVEVAEGEVVDITKDLGLSKKTLTSVMRSTRRATINNAKILEAIDGEINVEGDFSEASLLKFNTRVLEKAKSGAYSQSNFAKAEEAVKREGDIAVKRLEKFKADQSEANARMLTPAGRQYAELMVEAQQAGMFIASASMAENDTSTSYSSRNVSVRSQTANIQQRTPINNGMAQADPTPQSNTVLNDLNRRKRA